MFKKFITILSLLVLSLNLYAIELDFNYDIGDVFVNGEMDIKKDVEGVFNAGVRVGEVMFTDNDSNLCLSINPFVWNGEYRYNPSREHNRFSFLNLELFYDLFSYNKENMILGPYISANYLDFVNMSFSDYQVDLGFKFSYLWKNPYKYLKSETVTLRSGFRMRDNKPSIFVEGSFNLGGFILGIINDSYEDAKDFKENYY